MPTHSPFCDVDTALEHIRAGRMVVVIDDEDRENEGDLTMAAEKITPEAINFMAKYGRGLVCLAMTEERLDHLRGGCAHQIARLGADHLPLPGHEHQLVQVELAARVRHQRRDDRQAPVVDLPALDPRDRAVDELS